MSRKMRRGIAAYALLSAAFWLWMLYPWLTRDPEVVNLELVLPLELAVAEVIALVIAGGLLLTKADRLAFRAVAVVVIFKLLEFAAIATVDSTGSFLAALRCAIWLYILNAIWQTLSKAPKS